MTASQGRIEADEAQGVPAHPRHCIDPADLTGLILAGGRALRMGGADKGLQPWHGQALALHVLRQLQPQVGTLLINANRHLSLYRAWGAPVVSDDADLVFAGPLAGMLAGLESSSTAYLLSVPCDAPRLPGDLARRLGHGLLAQGARMAMPRVGGRLQPVFCLMEAGLRDDLRAFLQAGERKVALWAARHRLAVVEFDDPLAFENFNTPDDLQRQDHRLSP